MAEVQYTKTAVMKTSDGDVTLTGGEARAFQRYLDDTPRFFKRTNSTTGVITYYDVMSAGCGFCQVATITPGTTTATEIACEDGIPNCPTEPEDEDTKTDDEPEGEDTKTDDEPEGEDTKTDDEPQGS